MSRIAATFGRLQQQKRKALIPYLMSGFPQAHCTPALMHAAVAAGADIIELGVPFSDPMADGPVIQQAAESAIAQGVGLAQVLDAVRAFRQRDTGTPVVLMGYANPVECYALHHGAGALARDAAAAGVDGMLVVDYPPEECADFVRDLRAQGLDMIFLLAPTSSVQRMEQVAQLASGYVYYVSVKGVTGCALPDTHAVAQALARIRAHVRIPVGVGFGIRSAATASAIAQHADAVIVGSKIIEHMAQTPDAQAAIAAAAAFLREIRAAL